MALPIDDTQSITRVTGQQQATDSPANPVVETSRTHPPGAVPQSLESVEARAHSVQQAFVEEQPGAPRLFSFNGGLGLTPTATAPAVPPAAVAPGDGATEALTEEVALQRFDEHFDAFDTARQGDPDDADGAVSREDLEAVRDRRDDRGNYVFSDEQRELAEHLLGNDALFDRLDVGAGRGDHDDLVSRADVDAVLAAELPPGVSLDADEAAMRAEGQEFGRELLEASNDPNRMEELFRENAARLDDPAFAAGAISVIPPDLLRVVPTMSLGDGEQKIRIVEQFSDLLGTATRSGQLSEQWVDGFFAGMKDSATARWAVGQLMRTGTFDTTFLARAVNDVVLASRADDASQIPITWSLDDPSMPDSGNEWILGAVARNPEASNVVIALHADELITGSSLSEAYQVGEIIRAGTITYRGTDASMAEYAARQVLQVVDEQDGHVPLTVEDALADLAVEYFDDLAYAASSPVDVPLDAQDPTRPGIEMPFETARDLLYAAGGMEHNQAKIFVAAGEWQDALSQRYGGDPNLQSAFGREIGALQSLVRGSLAARLIDDGRAVDQANESAREGFDTVVGLIESRGSSITGIVKDLALGWARDTLIPPTQAAAEAQRDYVDQTFQARREAFRDAGNYLLENPEQLESFVLGQNPPVTVNIHPQQTIEQVESAWLAAQIENGGSGSIQPVDADFTEPNGRGGLRIKPLDEMTDAERAAYVRWVGRPEVREVLLQQVDSQNQADDDIAPGTGGG